MISGSYKLKGRYQDHQKVITRSSQYREQQIDREKGTHKYIYIYIYIKRERKAGREIDRQIDR